MEAYALGEQAASGEGTSPPQYRRLEEKEGVITSLALPGLHLRTAWLWPATRPKVLAALRELGLSFSEL